MMDIIHHNIIQNREIYFDLGFLLTIIGNFTVFLYET